MRQVGGGSRVTNYSLYEFRNVKRWRIFKQNWNISISLRLIEFWCFGLPAALGKGQMGGGCLGALGVSPHMCTCMHMNRNCKWPPTWRHPCLSCLTCMCVCLCAWMHAWEIPHIPIPTPSPSTHLATHQGGTPGISQNSIELELIKIIQFCLKIWNLWRIPHPWVGVWFGGWVVDRCVDGWGWVKSLKILKMLTQSR